MTFTATITLTITVTVTVTITVTVTVTVTITITVAVTVTVTITLTITLTVTVTITVTVPLPSEYEASSWGASYQWQEPGLAADTYIRQFEQVRTAARNMETWKKLILIALTYQEEYLCVMLFLAEVCQDSKT